MRPRKWLILTTPIAIACSAAGSGALEDAGEMMADAGRVLVDAGEMLADAGEVLADAGSDDAEAQVPPSPPRELGCYKEVQQTRTSDVGTTVTTVWFAEFTAIEDAELDAWLCDLEVFGDQALGACDEPECTGEALPLPLDCTQTDLEREGSAVRARCGSRSVTTLTDGSPDIVIGQVRRTLRLRVRP